MRRIAGLTGIEVAIILALGQAHAHNNHMGSGMGQGMMGSDNHHGMVGSENDHGLMGSDGHRMSGSHSGHRTMAPDDGMSGYDMDREGSGTHSHDGMMGR